VSLAVGSARAGQGQGQGRGQGRGVVTTVTHTRLLVPAAGSRCELTSQEFAESHRPPARAAVAAEPSPLSPTRDFSRDRAENDRPGAAGGAAPGLEGGICDWWAVSLGTA
jgi:hypothetical protein